MNSLFRAQGIRARTPRNLRLPRASRRPLNPENEGFPCKFPVNQGPGCRRPVRPGLATRPTRLRESSARRCQSPVFAGEIGWLDAQPLGSGSPCHQDARSQGWAGLTEASTQKVRFTSHHRHRPRPLLPCGPFSAGHPRPAGHHELAEQQGRKITSAVPTTGPLDAALADRHRLPV